MAIISCTLNLLPIVVSLRDSSTTKAFNREAIGYQIHKDILYLASRCFLQIGTQYLGHVAAMAWCGMSVALLSVGIGIATVITSHFFMKFCWYGLIQNKATKLRWQLAHAIANFALSFFLNFTLLKYFSIGFEKSLAIADERILRYREFIQQTPGMVRNPLFEKLLALSARCDVFLKELNELGYTPLNQLVIFLSPMFLTGLNVFNNKVAMKKGLIV